MTGRQVHMLVLNVGTMKNEKGVCQFTKADVTDTIGWCIGKNSPVTGAPCHPERHDTEKKSQSSNPFAVLEDSGRPVHSLLTGDFPEFAYRVLSSDIGKHAWKMLRMTYSRGAKRVVFSAPKTAAAVGLEGVYFQNGAIVGEGEAEGALLIVDVDANGFVYIQTGFPEQDMPADAGRRAGNRDCYCVQGDDVVVIDDDGKIRPEILGGITSYNGKTTQRF
jgi:hypothetical protein